MEEDVATRVAQLEHEVLTVEARVEQRRAQLTALNDTRVTSRREELRLLEERLTALELERLETRREAAKLRERRGPSSPERVAFSFAFSATLIASSCFWSLGHGSYVKAAATWAALIGTWALMRFISRSLK